MMELLTGTTQNYHVMLALKRTSTVRTKLQQKQKVCYKRVLPEDQIEFQTADNRTSAPPIKS